MRILLAGGGTGGHVFPALVVAGEVCAREPASQVLFVGTQAGLEARLIPKHGYEIAFIDAAALKGMGWSARLKAIAQLPRALVQAIGIVRRFRPDVVLGVGGYSSGPVVLAARILGKPTVLAESNAVPGLTNRLLGRIASVVCLAFEAASRHFPPSKVRVTGNPVRPTLLASNAKIASSAPKQPSVLVFGGSRGAKKLNELAANALIQVHKQGFALQVVHQTGDADLEATRACYAQAQMPALVLAFIDDMAKSYQEADLVIARAGATTVAELALVGRPAILVPYPYAADDHQAENAKVLRDAGAALMFRQESLEEAVLADLVRSLLQDPDRRAAMAQAMKQLARPDAAARVVDECQRLAGMQ